MTADKIKSQERNKAQSYSSKCTLPVVVLHNQNSFTAQHFGIQSQKQNHNIGNFIAKYELTFI